MKKWILAALFGMASAYALADGMMTPAPDSGMQQGSAMSMQKGDAMTMSPGMSKGGAMAKAEFGGACPVGLAKAHKNVPGSAMYASLYKGKTYYCSSAKAKAMFDKHPKTILAMAKKEWKKMKMNMEMAPKM